MHPPSYLRLKLFLPDQSGNRGDLRAKVNVLEIFHKIVKQNVCLGVKIRVCDTITQFTLIWRTSGFVLFWH